MVTFKILRGIFKRSYVISTRKAIFVQMYVPGSKIF